MKRAFAQYKAVMKALALNSFTFTLQKNGSPAKRRSALGGKIGIALVYFLVMVYGAAMSFSMTIAAYDNGIMGEYFHFIIFLGQIIVLFFGGYAAMSYLYFSKDNVLLATLPVSAEVLFAAKFTMTYVTELLFSFLIVFPMLTASGVTALVFDLGLPSGFFAVELVAIITTPIIPLVLVTALAMPLMKLLSKLKGKVVGSGILTTIFYLVAFIGYFALIGTFTNFSTDEESGMTILPDSTLQTFALIRKATIFNYPLVEALLGNNSALFALAYLGGSIVLLVLVIFIARFIYRKGVMFVLETSGLNGSIKTKNEKTEKYSQASPMKAMLIKEFRTLVKSPMLLTSTLITTLMPIIVMFAYKFMFSAMDAEEDDEFMVNFISGMAIFICYVLIAGGNQAALIGFSREGKSIMITRSLPINSKVIINSKLIFATSLTLVSSLVCAVAYPFSIGEKTIVGAIGLFLFLMVGGFGMNAINLLGDLKNPNFKWNNVNELTKNNRKSIKPMLISMAVGIYAVVAQIVIAKLGTSLQGEIKFLILFAICLIPVTVIAVVGYGRLTKKYAEYIKNMEV